MTNPIHSSCPKCGAPIPENAPQGLCPKCVLAGAATVPQPQSSPAGRTPAPSIAELAPHFPELEILEVIGVGGMGAVYKARQPKLDRLVALKILSSDLSKDPAFAERFNREARVLARLNHPNIVTVFDFGTAGPFCFLLMEYVDGVNLRQAMRAGGFTPTESLGLVQDICTALKFAHESGILHRDIKPENVLIDARGRVKIADFGIAKLVGKDGRDDATLTMHGAVLGTPHYMAPEQIETPGEVDQRADIYSLGVVFYELLTRELPIGRFAPPSERSPMDRRIDEIVMRALEKDRKARYQTAEEVRTSVGALAQSPSAPPKSRAPQQTGEHPAAKSSLAAAILTGISLPLAIIVFVAFTTRLPGPPGPVEHVGSAVSVGAILALLSALATLCCAVIGFILGARALGEIRRSGGFKTGLGSAIFATTAWPIVFMGFLSLILLKVPMPGGGSIGLPFAMLLTGVPYLLAIFFLIRGLRRWARGVEGKDGQKNFPGLTRTLMTTLGLAVLGPVLAAVLPPMFGPTRSRDVHQGETRAAGNMSSGALPHASQNGPTVETPQEEVRWRTWKPEVTVALAMQEGQKAKLRAFLQDVGGNTWDFDLGHASYRAELPRAKVVFEFGTELYSTMQRLVITKSVPDGRLIRSLEDLRGWEFNGALPEVITFDSVGKHQVQIAANKGRPAEALILEVVVTK